MLTLHCVQTYSFVVSDEVHIAFDECLRMQFEENECVFEHAYHSRSAIEWHNVIGALGANFSESSTIQDKFRNEIYGLDRYT